MARPRSIYAAATGHWRMLRTPTLDRCETGA
jgi:hypothetical protein